MQVAEAAPSGRKRGHSQATLAWLRLVRVYAKVDHVSQEYFRKHGMSVAQFHVLARVGANEGITQQELANSLLVTKGNVCQLLDRLAAAGLMERRQEGRSNRLFLTPKGRRVHDEVAPGHEALIAEQFSALSADDQAQMLRHLRTIDHALRG